MCLKIFRVKQAILFLVILWSLPITEWGRLYSQSFTPSPDSKLKIDRGMKNISNYTWKEYKSQPQNWAVIQDKRGVIYVANNGSVLEFDGASWKKILVPNTTVRSLAVDDKGIIYVGGINEIGLLKPDSKGELKYESLINHLEKKYRNFSHVWRAHCAKEGVYFCTSKFLFLRDFEKIKVWQADGNFAAPFLCRGKLYTRQNGIGLLELKRKSLKLVPGGEEFASKPIYMIAPYDTKRLLIGTRSADFYLYDGKKLCLSLLPQIFI